MPLSNDLISQFVKITKDETKTKPETSTYGTVVGELDGRATLRLDGSDLITPASKTADVRPGDRVTVMIKNHTAVITGNLSSPAARVADLIKAGVDISTFEALLAGTATVKELNAMEARVDDLEAKTLTADQIDAVEAVIDILDAGVVTVKDLSVVEARVEVLEADMLTATNADLKYAKISDIDATNAEIYQLSSSYAEFKNATVGRLNAAEATIGSLSSTYATIAMLNAEKAKIVDLEADVADIDTLIFGSATGSTIQTSFANAVIAQLGNAQIKSAMIDSIVASKITSGDIITNNVRVKSSDGRLIISDQTMQISDATRVRVQIGKDASNDYSINIWDASGNLMFSKGGITDSAIKSAIIRNDMVSETANISASKLDIDSLFEEINDSTNTIKSTRVYLDENKQALDVAFKSLSSTVTSQGQTITSQGTAISIIQGQITSKIWQQDIDTAKNAMSTQYSALEQSLNSYKTTVGETYATNVDLFALESSITQLSNRITANVSETTSLGTRMSTVEQTASGLTTRLSTAETNILGAAKTATNYLDFSGTGVVIGDLTKNTLGKNVLIDSDSVDIRNGTTVLASYGETIVELGKNSSEAIISLCGNKGQIEYDSEENYFQMSSDYLRLKGNSAASLYSNYYNNASFGQRSAINVGPGSIYIYSQESANIDPDTQVGVWTTSTLQFDPTRFSLLTDSISEISRYGSTYSTVSGNITLEPYGRTHSKASLIVSPDEKYNHNDGIAGWYIGTDGTAHATHASGGALLAFHYNGSEAYTSIIRETSSGVISINGVEYATNKILWSGAYTMSASQTATLSQKISDQATGIALIFSRYSSNTAQNYHFNTVFVPKAFITKHAGCGHLFMLSTDGTFSVFGSKYLYVHDAKLVGNDVNATSGTGSCGIAYNNGGFVLRYVIGV